MGLGEEMILQPTGRQVTHNSLLYENQDFNVLKITNLTFKTDI
jgi:hypothetical protein